MSSAENKPPGESETNAQGKSAQVNQSSGFKTKEQAAGEFLSPESQPAGEQIKPPAQGALDEITARGRNLFEYDRACSLATDALFAQGQPDEEQVRQYVAVKVNGGWKVVFGKLNDDKTAFAMAFEISIAQGSAPGVTRFEKGSTDQGVFLNLARAADLCVPITSPTGPVMNYAVLPASDGQYWVYVYPGTNEPGKYLLGGDVRYLVIRSSDKVLETRQLHRTVLTWPRAGTLPPGAKEAAGVHNSIMDDIPEDTDVSHVLSRKPQLPEYVGTTHWLFAIAPDGSIRFVGAIQGHRQ